MCEIFGRGVGWCVQLEKPQISLQVCAAWLEAPMVATVSMTLSVTPLVAQAFMDPEQIAEKQAASSIRLGKLIRGLPDQSVAVGILIGWIIW